MENKYRLTALVGELRKVNPVIVVDFSNPRSPCDKSHFNDKAGAVEVFVKDFMATGNNAKAYSVDNARFIAGRFIKEFAPDTLLTFCNIGETWPVDLGYVERVPEAPKTVRIRITATVETTVKLAENETIEQFKTRNVDVYLHALGDEGYMNKVDLGANSWDISIVEDSPKELKGREVLTVTYTVPSFIVPALINKDWSGLDETEKPYFIDWMDERLEEHGGRFYALSCVELTYCKLNDYNDYDGDCHQVTFHVNNL